MNLKALSRPGHLGRTTTQLNRTPRTRRQLPHVGRVVPAGRLSAHWIRNDSGRLVLEWTLERPAHLLISRGRGESTRLNT